MKFKIILFTSLLFTFMSCIEKPKGTKDRKIDVSHMKIYGEVTYCNFTPNNILAKKKKFLKNLEKLLNNEKVKFIIKADEAIEVINETNLEKIIENYELIDKNKCPNFISIQDLEDFDHENSILIEDLNRFIETSGKTIANNLFFLKFNANKILFKVLRQKVITISDLDNILSNYKYINSLKNHLLNVNFGNEIFQEELNSISNRKLNKIYEWAAFCKNKMIQMGENNNITNLCVQIIKSPGI